MNEGRSVFVPLCLATSLKLLSNKAAAGKLTRSFLHQAAGAKFQQNTVDVFHKKGQEDEEVFGIGLGSKLGLDGGFR